MNEIKIFENPMFGRIRTLEENGEPWFVGKDVTVALGYSNTRDALAKHVDTEDKNSVAFRDGTSGNPNQTIINESGVYSLILSSKLPTAKAFKRWVTSEVLPSIRKTGGYGTSQQNLYIEAARIMATCLPENRKEVIALLSQVVPIGGSQRWPQVTQPVPRRHSDRVAYFHTERLAEIYRTSPFVTIYGIAKALGVSKSSVRGWIRGDWKPTKANAEKLADYLGVYSQELYQV